MAERSSKASELLKRAKEPKTNKSYSLTVSLVEDVNALAEKEGVNASTMAEILMLAGLEQFGTRKKRR